MRSRGNDTTVTRRGSGEMCTSRLTSLSRVVLSAPVQRAPNRCAILLLALVDARHEQVHATLDRTDIGRDGFLSVDIDHFVREARGEVVRRIGGDRGGAHQRDAEGDRQHLAELRQGVRRAQPCMPRHSTPSSCHRAAPSCVGLP